MSGLLHWLGIVRHRLTEGLSDLNAQRRSVMLSDADGRTLNPILRPRVVRFTYNDDARERPFLVMTPADGEELPGGPWLLTHQGDEPEDLYDEHGRHCRVLREPVPEAHRPGLRLARRP